MDDDNNNDSNSNGPNDDQIPKFQIDFPTQSDRSVQSTPRYEENMFHRTEMIKRMLSQHKSNFDLKAHSSFPMRSYFRGVIL